MCAEKEEKILSYVTFYQFFERIFFFLQKHARLNKYSKFTILCIIHYADAPYIFVKQGTSCIHITRSRLDHVHSTVLLSLSLYFSTTLLSAAREARLALVLRLFFHDEASTEIESPAKTLEQVLQREESFSVVNFTRTKM